MDYSLMYGDRILFDGDVYVLDTVDEDSDYVNITLEKDLESGNPNPDRTQVTKAYAWFHAVSYDYGDYFYDKDRMIIK